MDVPTYPFNRPTIAGLIVTGRLAPLPLPRLGRHAEHVNPDAITVEQLTARIADEPTVAWFTDQTARIQRVALPALDAAS